ncbi:MULTISPECIES: hypothetical protein [Alphaproteobacteria]|uniref:Uncharacterized protein n=2 Tax=Alphaproteobacteria TaxID=28211 RepID=A0A512HJ82_9HYPH|nr:MULTISPECIES: hypothetical protein [Alphaproteobacteria]GEO85504.1 hypothetical protein RNA01_24360 [Ciceribacter naphthalenivorans]GLR21474.1 hypothetical protein GCM10007920_12600 [Ciceribacter naphthalenivorans]GLT04330.1 hypothetical protein GCM10007926_12600 [Sphingomonas psychrolutea]
MPDTGEASRHLPRPNRVTPFGDLESTAARGALMGNRGDLHGQDGTIRRHHLGKAWICCTLTEKNGRRAIFDTKGHYTPLFFHDETVAFAAGHRPCAECRRADFLRFKRYFNRATGLSEEHFVAAGEIDAQLHRQRLDGREKRLHRARLVTLPDGAFFILETRPQTPFLLWRGKAHPWSHEGYGTPAALPEDGDVSVLTPPLIVGVLRAGYQVEPRF